MATLSSSTGRAAGWRGGPALGSAQPRARALQRFRPNRSPDDVAVDRWDRARAHARGRPAPRAATSGALVLVRFRVAALLAGRPWGLVTRAGVHERSRRRGSARCPESGRCAGGGRRCQEAPLSPGGLGLPQSGPDGVAQDPRRGAVPGCWKGGGGGRGAARPGSLELRVSGPPPPPPPATLDKSFLLSGSQFPCCQMGETLSPSLFLDSPNAGGSRRSLSWVGSRLAWQVPAYPWALGCCFLPSLAILFLGDVLSASQGSVTRLPGSRQVNKQCVTVRINWEINTGPRKP